MFRNEAFGHEIGRRRAPPTDFDCYRAQAAAQSRPAVRTGRGATTVAAALCLIVVMLLVAA